MIGKLRIADCGLRIEQTKPGFGFSIRHPPSAIRNGPARQLAYGLQKKSPEFGKSASFPRRGCSSCTGT
jgi:hypothetical protein